MQINEYAAVFFGDGCERALDDRVAIAGRGAEHVSGEAVGMDAYQRRAGFRKVSQLTAHQRHVQLVVRVVRIRDHAEISMPRGQHGFCDAAHMPFMLHAIANQVRDGQQFHSMQAAEFHQLRDARHGPVIVHDFADHAGMVQPSEARQVHRSFRLSRAHQHAAIARTQSVNMPGRARSSG